MRKSRFLEKAILVLAVLSGLGLLIQSTCHNSFWVQECDPVGSEKGFIAFRNKKRNLNTSTSTNEGELARKKVPLPRSPGAFLDVVDSNGTPLPGSKVILVRGGLRKNVQKGPVLGKTDQKGRFLVKKNLVKRSDCVLVRKEGFQARVVKGGALRSKKNIEIILKEGYEASIKVQTLDNFPVKGATVAVSPSYIPDGFLMEVQELRGTVEDGNIVFVGKTGSDGVVCFSELPKGAFSFGFFKEGVAVKDVTPRLLVLPGGPFTIFVSPVYIAIGKIKGLRTYSSFFRPPPGFSSRFIGGSPFGMIRKKFPGCIFALGMRSYSLADGWLPVPKKIRFHVLIERIGWRNVDLTVKPLSSSGRIQPEQVSFTTKDGDEILGYVVIRPKFKNRDLENVPPKLFLVEPIRSARHVRFPDPEIPFGFVVEVPPFKKIGLPEGEYKLFSFVPFVEKMIPKGFKVVSLKGATRVYDVCLDYEFSPVFFKFIWPDGSVRESGNLHLEVKRLGSIVTSFTPVEATWLPCTELQGFLSPRWLDEKKVEFSFRVKRRKRGSPMLVEIHVPKR